MSAERFPNQSGTGILGAVALVGSLAWVSLSGGRGAGEPAPYAELTPPAVQQPHQVLFAASLLGKGERIDLGPQLAVLQAQLNVPLSNDAFTRDWTWIQALVREINEVKNAGLTEEQCAAIAGKALLTYKRYEVQAANSAISKLPSLEELVQRVNLATGEQRKEVFSNFGPTLVAQIELFFQEHTAAGR